MIKMSEDERDVGFRINSASAAIKRSMAASLRRSGIDEITASHGYLLCYLVKHDGKDIYQKDIEARFSIGRSAVATAIGAMEKKGYITRSSVESDARLKKITITQKGIEAHIRITEVIRAFEHELTAGLSPEALDVFFDTVSAIKLRAETISREQS